MNAESEAVSGEPEEGGPVDDQNSRPRQGVLISDAVLDSWAVRFSLLGDINRLKILLALHQAPGISVGELAATVGMSDNAVSQALSALRLAGLVASDRDGRFRRWSLTDQVIHEILHSVGASHSDLNAAH